MSLSFRRRRPDPQHSAGSRTPPAPAPPSEPPVLPVMPVTPCMTTRAGIDLPSRALELANDDWTEQEAALELARLADFDREILLCVYEQLVAELVRAPGLDARRVRATRVVSRAARLTAARACDGQELRPHRW